MLTMKSYPAEYVAACKARVRSDIAAFTLSKAPAQLERVYFQNLLLALEMSFVHRTRAVEGKDGNALNEVRVMCTSALLHDGVMTPDTTIKLSSETSVLGTSYGETFALDATSFERLSDAFFTELGRRFVQE